MRNNEGNWLLPQKPSQKWYVFTVFRRLLMKSIQTSQNYDWGGWYRIMAILLSLVRQSTSVSLTVMVARVVSSIRIMKVLEQDSFRKIVDSHYKTEDLIFHWNQVRGNKTRWGMFSQSQNMNMSEYESVMTYLLFLVDKFGFQIIQMLLHLVNDRITRLFQEWH